ncbi:hypothetical protein [Bradyrhizobium sp. AZCC 1693]
MAWLIGNIAVEAQRMAKVLERIPGASTNVPATFSAQVSVAGEVVVFL